MLTTYYQIHFKNNKFSVSKIKITSIDHFIKYLKYKHGKSIFLSKSDAENKVLVYENRLKERASTFTGKELAEQWKKYLHSSRDRYF